MIDLCTTRLLRNKTAVDTDHSLPNPQKKKQRWALTTLQLTKGHKVALETEKMTMNIGKKVFKRHVR